MRGWGALLAALLAACGEPTPTSYQQPREAKAVAPGGQEHVVAEGGAEQLGPRPSSPGGDPRLLFPRDTSHVFRARQEMMADDLALFARVGALPVGEIGELALDDEEIGRNLGLLPAAPQHFRRQADLVSIVPQLALSSLPDIDQIDCVAISSIDRHNGEPPYLYDTLRSIFSAFPVGVQVNVLVGNDDTAYVARERLAEEIGDSRLGAVHIWPTSAAQTAYLRQHLPPNRRGGWNYARALRSYQGSRGLVMMEDDVAWSLGGVERFNALYRQRPLPAVSLYNIHCQRLAPGAPAGHSGLRIDEIDTTHFEFYCLQGMYYHSSITAALGRYVQRRMHTKVYDNVIGFFFTDNQARIGYAFPSIVQHMGRQTSCDSWEFLQSGCYQPSFDGASPTP